MNPILRNILAVVAGFIGGSIINMGIIMVGNVIIPPPAGVDNTSMDGIRDGMHLFNPENFLFPFLAHALGTFSGALFAALIAIRKKMNMAMIVGIFFFVGGIINAIMLPAPAWFIAVDLLLAYIPMAWIAGKLMRI